MAIEQLTALAAPPAASADVPDNRWQQVEDALEMRLPDDYKDLVQAYGAGRFASFLTVFTPFARNGYVNLLAQRELALDAYRTVRARFPEAAPFPASPEPGGLLPWARPITATWCTG